MLPLLCLSGVLQCFRFCLLECEIVGESNYINYVPLAYFAAVMKHTPPVCSLNKYKAYCCFPFVLTRAKCSGNEKVFFQYTA